MTTKIEYAIGDIVKSVREDFYMLVTDIRYDCYVMLDFKTGVNTTIPFPNAHSYYKRARA